MTKKFHDWHFSRPALAKKYLDLFDIGLTSARALFARRRMGKTEFLKKDLMPASVTAGYLTVYVNLWDLETDPVIAIVSEFYKVVAPKGFEKIWATLKKPIDKIKISGKAQGLGEASIEAVLNNNPRVYGTLLMEAMTLFDKTKQPLIFIIDEAQVLAYEENIHFAHALRSAFDIRKERIKVIFAGSSETTLRKMFGVASEPFYNWAPLEPFELLGETFVAAMVQRVNAICKYSLSHDDAMLAFLQLKSTPEFFRRYIEQYLNNPINGSMIALENTKNHVFSDKNFKRQWDALLATDQIILSMIAAGITDLYAQSTLQRLGRALGIGDDVNKNTTHNALIRLLNKQLITKIEYGLYQFEDEAFADWVRHQEG